ncbi:DUF2138 family protein [Roseateles sp.]|uniref:DUF2138 family protein n=1 Tax=Roseateles sp. TaxID=1971397 RepID=UPI0032677EE5
MLSRKKIWIVGGVAVTAAVVGAFTMGWTRFSGNINALEVNLARPDAYIATTALSKLPRDLIKAPIARDVLTEDFAFYYEEHEDRLGLKGALKRIAYEHDTTLADKLLELALDEPAEIAMWTDAKGAPRYWLIAMTRGVLAKSLQGIATIAAKDKQLSVIGDVRFNGSAATVYALTLSPRRTLAIVSQGNRVVVLSDPGLLFDTERQADSASRDVIGELLSGDAKAQSVYRRGLGLGEPGTGHTIVADTRMLSFGYQHFFPGFKAMRLDLAAGGATLRTQLRVENASALPTAPADRAVWQALPMNPAACTLLPADWSKLKLVFGDAAGQQATKDQTAAWTALTDQLEGPAAVCWYAKSQLHTPVFVALTKANAPDPTAALDSLSSWLLKADPSEAAEAPRQPDHKGVSRWQREVSAPWGPHGDGEQTSYRPTLARQGRWIVFSPDDTLVGLALDAQARRYPSVADALPAQTATLAVLAPRQIADLAQREAFQVLPPNQELFLQAAKTHLVPRLDALRKLPAARAVAAGKPDSLGWVAVDWQPIATTGRP